MAETETPPRRPRPFGVSVVIPSFNREAELLRAVESVQTGRPGEAEIVVVDDASRVDPRPRLPAANGSGVPVRSFRFAANRGPQAARNLGLRRARFSHVAFLDCDDVFLPAKMDTVLARLAGRETDLLFHPVTGLERYAAIARFWWRWLRPVLPLRNLLALLNPVPTPALVLRRRRCLGLASLRHSEDWAYLLHYLQPGMRVDWLDQPLAAVSRPAGSAGGLSADAWRMRRGEFQARRMLLRTGKPGDALRWLAGSAAGSLRLLADLLRGRYWR